MGGTQSSTSNIQAPKYEENINIITHVQENEEEVFSKISDLTKEILIYNPEDIYNFSIIFFRKLRSCQHVLSKDLSFIRESKYNRQSFVVCLVEAFSGFPENTEMTIYEFSAFIELSFSGFTVDLLEDFYLFLEPSPIDSLTEIKKYKLNHLLSSLYFWIVYENWLNELSSFSKGIDIGKESKKTVNIPAVLAWADSSRYDLNYAPPKEIIVTLLSGILEFRGESVIYLDKLKQMLFLNTAIQSDILEKLPKIV